MRCARRLRLALAVARRPAPVEAVDLRRDVLLLVRELLGLLPRALDVALRAVALVALELLLRLAQLVERRRRLRAAVLRSVGRRLPHRVAASRICCAASASSWPLLLARQLLELPRGLFELVGELALARRRRRRRCCCWPAAAAALPLGFLLLPPRELLQLLGELVDLLVAALLLGALLHLVLVRELVELELEQVREILRQLALAAAAATAAAALAHLHLVVLLGVLQQLQRALLGRERFLRLLRLEVAFGRLHLGRRLRQRLGDLLERRIDDADARLHLADELLDLRAQLRLREVEEHDVLAVLVGRHLRLVAHDVERRRDDLPLLLRQLADLAAAAATAAAGLRLRRPCSPSGTAGLARSRCRSSSSSRPRRASLSVAFA